MTTRKQWVPQGTYDNQETQRRETYDSKGNLIASAGHLYVAKKPGHHGKFGKLPDVPVRPIDWKDNENE